MDVNSFQFRSFWIAHFNLIYFFKLILEWKNLQNDFYAFYTVKKKKSFVKIEDFQENKSKNKCQNNNVESW